VKIGLYSITYLGVWYKGGALSLIDFIKQAKRLGYSGVEIDGKRPHGNPMDLSPRARKEIKEIAAGEGMDMVGVAGNNDFCSPIPEHREAQLLMVREQIKLAADLGAPVVRLFVSWPGITYAHGIAQYDIAGQYWAARTQFATRYEMWDWARECFREAAHIAESEGVTLGLQNHHPIIRDYRDVLDMIKEVNSPAFKACLDVPCEDNQDDAWVRKAVQDVGDLQVLCHFNGEWERNAEGKVVQRDIPYYRRGLVNYPVFINELKKVGYKGYHTFEFCHQALNDKLEIQDRAFVDEQAALALEYLRDIMQAEGVYEE